MGKLVRVVYAKSFLRVKKISPKKIKYNKVIPVHHNSADGTKIGVAKLSIKKGEIVADITYNKKFTVDMVAEDYISVQSIVSEGTMRHPKVITIESVSLVGTIAQ